MCHGAALAAFPKPMSSEAFDHQVQGFMFGPDKAERVAILPDIYGCNPFYQGLATHLANQGAQAFLIDPFHGLGTLEEPSREAAFARRNRVMDKTFVDRFEAFVGARAITSVVGFCLGGLYVFELARRGCPARLLGLYGFPQGLPNQDPLPAPFDYLGSVTKPFGMLMGAEDESVGAANIAKLRDMAASAPAMDLVVYEQAGHNFLPMLDSDIAHEQEIGRSALSRIEGLIK